MSRSAADGFSRLLRRYSSCFLLQRPSSHLPINPSTLIAGQSLPSPLHQASRSSAAAATKEEEEDASHLFRRWGCTNAEVSRIIRRQPSILRMNLPSLQSKLQTLRDIGILAPDLVRIITCRPRFLSGRIGPGLDRRLNFLRTLFPSDAGLLRAIVRNPSLLNYDVDRTMRPCVLLYEAMGIDCYDLGRLLLSRPTIIPRSTLDDEKLDLIRRTRLPRDAPMYKYAVSIIAVSHLETIHSKVANLEKFGFTADEVMGLFARTPNVLTLSIDKVQRNMTYIIGIMKLPPRIVLDEPLLLYCNLEKVMKPRYLLGLKLQEMRLEPQIRGSSLASTMRMKEPRFLKVFVMCHKGGAAKSLMDFYTSVKEVRRLAESSRSVTHKGFPF